MSRKWTGIDQKNGTVDSQRQRNRQKSFCTYFPSSEPLGIGKICIILQCDSWFILMTAHRGTIRHFYGTDLGDLTRVVSSPREWNMVNSCGHVNHDLVSMHRDWRPAALLQGQDNNCCVVSTQHALFPKQQGCTSQATGARHPLWSLRIKEDAAE